MAMHYKSTETWEVGSDTALTQTDSRRSSSLTSTDIIEHAGGQYLIPNAASDLAIDFGPVTTAYALRIETDQPIQVKLNGSATAIPIGRTAGVKASLQLSDTTGITSLSITVPGSTDANVYISLPGI